MQGKKMVETLPEHGNIPLPSLMMARWLTEQAVVDTKEMIDYGKNLC